MNKCEILLQEEELDYRNCTDRFWVLKCSAFFMNSKSRQSPALLHAPVCFPAPCVEEEKQEGKTEHKLSDAWTYEYLSVNASRWPWITQTECPGRVPHLRGDLYDHEMISRQDGFREIDPFVFGLTPPRWCMIAAIICVRIWFVSSSSDNTSVRICFLGLYFL